MATEVPQATMGVPMTEEVRGKLRREAVLLSTSAALPIGHLLSLQKSKDDGKSTRSSRCYAPLPFQLKRLFFW
jgi:hypothetical protein